MAGAIITYSLRIVDPGIRTLSERFDKAIAHGAWQRRINQILYQIILQRMRIAGLTKRFHTADDTIPPREFILGVSAARLLEELAISIRTAVYYRALVETDLPEEWLNRWLQV